MKYLFAAISLLLTVSLIVILNTTLVLPAPLGKLLSPQHGVWQNAEPDDEDFSGAFHFSNMKGKVEVYFDERLVPHVFAENEADLYFVQGYLHAKFRLWQMELQTHAAAGRVSEIIGDKGLQHDREFRRLGMVYAAENSLKEMEADPATKLACDSYTAGVNAYIQSLKESSLPLEYKLIGYAPEKWTNLKTALFLKYMSFDLAGHDDDFEMSNAKRYFSPEDFSKLYPFVQDSLDPIVPKGTVFEKPGVAVNAPAGIDSFYNNNDILNIESTKPDRDNGSNNWAVAGTKTKTGAPILCNDPHLGLNLPSLWYEMQLSTPEFSAYGVTFPGAPSVIIGFNDHCAFGFTNGGRDVRDYYEIKFKDDSKKEYWFDSSWKKTDIRVESIKVKGKPDYLDTVAYTVFGPVMYDKSFGGNRVGNGRSYAVRWKAHDTSNELKIFYLLNRAKDYNDYSAAVVNLHTPGQNCIFACKNGDIAIRTQGEWPAKWKEQGDYVMPGTDSSFMWQGMIPDAETPYQYNPERGFVSSANQKPADESYPYYLGRSYPLYRGITVNRKLSSMSGITVQDMMKMQTDNYNVFAEYALPLLQRNLKVFKIGPHEMRYFDMLVDWDFNNNINSKAATVFSVLWHDFDSLLLDDEFAHAPKVIMRPFESSVLESLLKDSVYKFADNIQTPETETLPDIVTAALQSATKKLRDIEKEGRLDWGKYKLTSVNHLARLAPFSVDGLSVGGGVGCINATKETHGPSWRMIVSLTPNTEAYGVYPGGQSGNPGSKYYSSFINQWAEGKYYTLWHMKKQEAKDKRVKFVMTFSS